MAEVREGNGVDARAGFPGDPEDFGFPGAVGFEVMSRENQEALVANFKDSVHTSVAGAIMLTEEGRDTVALLGCGDLLVSEANPYDAVVPYVENAAVDLGLVVKRRLLVAKSTIVRVYSAIDSRVAAADFGLDQSRSESYLEALLDEAVGRRVTDVHIAVRRNETIVELRVDGMLEKVEPLTRTMGEQVLRVAYYSCNDSRGGTFTPFNYLEGRMTGRRLRLPNGVQAVRCQFNPLASECNYAVMRLLTQRSVQEAFDVDELGYSAAHVEILRRVRHSPYGLVLIAGVTSSGKSTTLHVTLERQIEEREGQINVLTIEDPVESDIRGAKQMTIAGDAESRGEGFAAAIAAALRSDPDVIMVGEVREHLSANAAVTATQTGHQVWTTVHAISAATAIDRLLSEGVPEHRLLDPLVMRASIAQRLVARLCTHCAVPFPEAVRKGHFDVVPGYVERLSAAMRDADVGELLGTLRVRNREGCDAPGCRKGYGGRELVAEVVEIDEEFIDAFRENGCHAAQRDWTQRSGGLLMAEHGMMKVLGGRVDPLDLFFSAGHVREDRMGLIVEAARREGLLGQGG